MQHSKMAKPQDSMKLYNNIGKKIFRAIVKLQPLQLYVVYVLSWHHINLYL